MVPVRLTSFLPEHSGESLRGGLGVSAWAGEFEFSNQIPGHPQFPTPDLGYEGRGCQRDLNSSSAPHKLAQFGQLNLSFFIYKTVKTTLSSF